jgi:D-alanine-D-alanine ligase-like ATP-grasp enzyme
MDLRKFKIKTFSWEYWPIWVVYFPVSFYYLYLALKARSLFFFSAANPSIETGGMFFESKWKIFELIPKEYYPKTILIEAHESFEEIQQKIVNQKIKFPFITKPDRGERGWGVQKINNFQELQAYKGIANIDFLIQSYVDYPLELSVFYYRKPSEKTGTITSVTLKKLLSVNGDGTSTIEQLIVENNRAYLQLDKLKLNTKIEFNKIPKINEEVILVPYGNHVLGAMFLNYNHIIEKKLIATFDKISTSIDGFYFGRFDLRCTSIEDLKNGKNIAILELNGSGAEPAHIYDPNFSFIKAQKVLAEHYKMMFEAATFNNKNGVDYMTYSVFKETRKKERIFKNKLAA